LENAMMMSGQSGLGGDVDIAAYDDLQEYGMDLVREFESAEDATRDARLLAERDRDYYDEKQWTSEEITALKQRGQPVVVFNRIKRKVNAMQGLEKQSRKDPRAFPRNPSDEDSARAATDALRFVCDQSDWDSHRSEAAFHIAVEGTGAIFVGFGAGKDGQDPSVRNIPWDRLYWDPHSTSALASDSNDRLTLSIPPEPILSTSPALAMMTASGRAKIRLASAASIRASGSILNCCCDICDKALDLRLLTSSCGEIIDRTSP